MRRQQTISEKLRRAAGQAKSSRALALAAGIDPASLRRFVKGERSLRLDKADRLAEALGFDLVQRRKV